jgi:hypothetical protein
MKNVARQILCSEKILGWIPWYADGGLSARQEGQVEAHAASCADCRDELDLVSGAPLEIETKMPDADRLFAEVVARIKAGDRDRRGAASAFAIPQP